jgi:uncharacterized protein
MAALASFGEPVSAALPAAFDPWFQARCPEIPLDGARAVLDLAAEGAGVPFIVRYRRDRTGRLGESAVRRVLVARDEWERLVARQAIILESIVRHATLTPELRERILDTFDGDVLEDLYLPYKQKKKSRSEAAREAGLDQLADWIWDCGHGTQTPQEGQTLELWAFTFRDPDKGVPDAKTAIEGARDILVERLAEDADLRALARKTYAESAFLHATKTDKAKPGGRFDPYFDFHEKVSALKERSGAQRYLAVRRGQSEGELLLTVGGPPGDSEFESHLVTVFEAAAVSVPDSPGADVLRQAARIAYKGHVRSALENEIHHDLKQTADVTLARVSAENVCRLLLEPPFGARPVLGIDPGVRAGGKVAVVDAAGVCVASGFVHLQTDEQRTAARRTIVALVGQHAVAGVAVGDGAAGRETEIFVRSALREAGLDTLVALVSETGAGAWAASDAVRAEFPDLDPPARGAVFIARRLQDPLRELVRIEPRAIAGRHHSHDIAPSTLIRELEQTLESVVNRVGVDLNTASRALLARVCGVGPVLASAIVEHREAKGGFGSKKQLLDVPRLGPKAFEQAAGFLRVRGGEQPLDATGVHPEHYPVLEALVGRLGKSVADLLGPGAALVREAAELEEQIGRWGREGVAAALEGHGQDPRGRFTPFSFRDDVRALGDLKPGMVCPGLVTNVASFGAFVDVGVGHDGLVHLSQLGRRSGKEPQDAIRPGERVQARVLKVDIEKRQVSLSLRPPPPERRPAASRRPGRPARATPPPAADRRPVAPRGDGGRRGPRTSPSSPPAPGRRPAAKPPRERRPAFNNPFAVLADLKLPKKGKS